MEIIIPKTIDVLCLQYRSPLLLSPEGFCVCVQNPFGEGAGVL